MPAPQMGKPECPTRMHPAEKPLQKTALECIVSTARNQAKADTVRKMQERLKAASHIESTITGYRYSVVDVAEIFVAFGWLKSVLSF